MRLFRHVVSASEVLSNPPIFLVILVFGSPADELFLQLHLYTWEVVLWGALVISHGSFGWPVASLNIREIFAQGKNEGSLRFECLQTKMLLFCLF